MMPLTLTLIRHGESESNAVKDLRKGDEIVPGEKELMAVHTSERRLTPKGVAEAMQCGLWMRDWMQSIRKSDRSVESLFRFYVSEYVRAEETGGNLGLRAQWRPDARIVERNWGEIDQLTYHDRISLFADKLAKRKQFAFYWRPSDGETLQDVFGRVKDFIATLYRECGEMHVIVVTHGETILAFRKLLEYWSPQRLRNEMLNYTPQTDIINCRVIQYTRVFGESPTKKFSHVRLVNPFEPDNPAKNLPWTPIVRPLLTDADLLREAEKHERFLKY